MVSPPSGSGAVAITVSEPVLEVAGGRASALRADLWRQPAERVDQHHRVGAARRDPACLLDGSLDRLRLRVLRGARS